MFEWGQSQIVLFYHPGEGKYNIVGHANHFNL